MLCMQVEIYGLLIQMSGNRRNTTSLESRSK